MFRESRSYGPYYRNQFGSIISPLEFKIAWDNGLTKRAFSLNDFLTPDLALPNNCKFVRVGSAGDGGYLLPDYWNECDGVISGGISDNNDFEFQLASQNIPVLQFDYSICEPPIQDQLLYFKREKLGIGGVSLSGALNCYRELVGKNLSCGILKLDIEGSEFDFIGQSNSGELVNFRIIVIEFHFLGNIYQDSYWKKVEEALKLIRQTHKPVVTMGNNSRAFVQLGGIPIYDIMEVTFVQNNDVVPFIDENLKLTSQVNERAPLRIL